ncbi:unnamed protein product [Moneuplotes crassus]|uniref:Protein kinase domain-containing protein n=1 Tax=Euplotes crassus TaxID=5936 RepID=A0AAD1U950_EUPCR|nr:unnamed protein product [Moneuplotes crassus]
MKTVGNYILCDKIGEGAFGAVYLVRSKNKPKSNHKFRHILKKDLKIACKQMKLKSLKGGLRKYLYREIGIMKQINHPNIMRLTDTQQTKSSIYIFMKFCNGGDLRRLLQLRGGKLKEDFVKLIISQIASGLHYLNENKIMHRDLKLDNIMINFPSFTSDGAVPDEYIQEFNHEIEEIEVIIGDLGFAKSMPDDNTTDSYCGTPTNMAPEIMNEFSYNSKVDIWSVGTIIYELLIGFPPFDGWTTRDLKKKVNKGDYGIPKGIKLSLSCVDLLSKCLKFEPKKRISHIELSEHSFIQIEDTAENMPIAVSKCPEVNGAPVIPDFGFAVSDKNAQTNGETEEDFAKLFCFIRPILSSKSTRDIQNNDLMNKIYSDGAESSVDSEDSDKEEGKHYEESNLCEIEHSRFIEINLPLACKSKKDTSSGKNNSEEFKESDHTENLKEHKVSEIEKKTQLDTKLPKEKEASKLGVKQKPIQKKKNNFLSMSAVNQNYADGKALKVEKLSEENNIETDFDIIEDDYAVVNKPEGLSLSMFQSNYFGGGSDTKSSSNSKIDDNYVLVTSSEIKNMPSNNLQGSTSS